MYSDSCRQEDQEELILKLSKPSYKRQTKIEVMIVGS